MRRKFLITGTDTGVGKTVVGCALAFALRARGHRVGVMKPAETGCEVRNGQLEPADAQALMLAASCTDPLELICPFRYRSPLAPAAAADHDGLPAPNLDDIADAYNLIARSSDVIIVEGAGGIKVPLTWNSDFADLAAALDLEVVVVAANRLGCINATLLTLDYAARRGLQLMGYILNDPVRDDSVANRTNLDSLKRLTAVPCLGTIAYKEPVRREVLSAIAPDLFRD